MISQDLRFILILKRLLAIFVLHTMLLPTAVHALVLVSDTEHTYELLLSDKKQESEKEEQQEDDSKDEKIEMQIVHRDDGHYHYTSELLIYDAMDAASDFILEIPFPPPERI